MSILFTKGPVFTTVQDAGRYGFQKLGINPNGVMDRTAARLINILLGNDEAAAALEMHFPAGEIEFEKEAIFAIGGADFNAELDGESVDTWKSYAAAKGAGLKFKSRKSGSRAYLAVAGGFDIEPWLESRSTNLTAHAGGLEGRRIRKGDRIATKQGVTQRAGSRLSRTVVPYYSRFPTVRLIAGPEFERLTAEAKDLLVSESFAVAPASNRMGYRLAGAPLTASIKTDMVSSPVTFGTIQMLPDGQMVILMADHQTTGGYPRIANVNAVDLPLVAQLDAGDKIGFELVPLESAEELMFAFERELAFLRVGVRFAKA